MSSARRLRLSTVLILINLVVLALPLGGIAVLRIYESALIRQTESELIAQGAFVAAAYQETLLRIARSERDARARLDAYGAPLLAQAPPPDPTTHWRPHAAELDLARDPILPPAPPPADAGPPPNAWARRAGRELQPILRRAQQTTLAGIRVVDPAGAIVASTGTTADADFGRSLAAQEEVARALTGEFVSALRWRQADAPVPPLASISRGTRIRVSVAVPVIHGERVLGAVLLVRTPADIRQTIWGKRRELAIGAIVLLALGVALALVTSLAISRPVRALMHQAQRAARGERGAVAPLAHPGTSEIAELSETVAAMAQTLEARAAYIRDFAMHVSHEFKTPLTAIQGTVELLRDHGATMSAEERTRFLGILDRDAKRLEQLVRRLLELARAENAATESADLTVGIDAAVVLRNLATHELGDRLSLHLPEGRLPVRVPADALQAVLGNLLDNAHLHAGPRAQVRISAATVPEGVEVIVADDGPGVSPANAARIFEPFFTTARERGGTGLGLSISRALLKAHGGDIALLPTQPGAAGAHFRVLLPSPVTGARH